MTDRRRELLEKILEERARQVNLPGSEWDARNAPNDWIAIINHYLSEEARRNSQIPEREKFEDSLIKAGAVLLAALEHTDLMAQNKHLKDRKDGSAN
jgi:hypothetical protein